MSQKELSLTEQKYTELYEHARTLLATGETGSTLDGLVYKKAAELAIAHTLGALGSSVVSTATNEAFLRSGEEVLTPELLTYHLATLTHSGERILRGAMPDINLG